MKVTKTNGPKRTQYRIGDIVELEHLDYIACSSYYIIILTNDVAFYVNLETGSLRGTEGNTVADLVGFDKPLRKLTYLEMGEKS